MKETITYECRKCGNRFVVSGKARGRLIPLYCCGEDITKTKKKNVASKKTVNSKKTPKKK